MFRMTILSFFDFLDSFFLEIMFHLRKVNKEFIDSLKMIHDFALYHTDLCFDTDEKNTLFNLKVLWERLEQIGEES